MGQAPARQAAMGAGIPSESGATTINKMCGSGMKSIMFGHDSIKAQQNNIVVAGGLENMTNAPYILSKARKGFRMGHADVKDHMFLDGLEDAYEEGKLMGSFAEDTAEHYQFTREQQDNFAITSLERAKKANEDGTFDSEIVPIKVSNRKNEIIINKDEQPFKSDITKIPTLKPAFKKNGTVTAANSSSISDGASSVILMLESEAQKRAIKPLARIINHSTNSQEPKWFTTAPGKAIEKILKIAKMTKNDIDIWEINEAFSAVAMAAIEDFELDDSMVNIYGGAVALGHPIGASGARILTTLLTALDKKNKNIGLATLCIGGGEASAMIIEKL